LVNEIAHFHKPVLIQGKQNNAVLVNEEDWQSIQETLYLSSIPGVRESLITGKKEHLSKCSKILKW
jgi:PHD/YefM family antitoxin component YafN of YafNO toxin-antitoxin module